nr:sperm protein 18 kDa [Haliotis discus hannai]
MRSLVLLCVLLMAVYAEGKRIHGVSEKNVSAMKVGMVKVLDKIPRRWVAIYTRLRKKLSPVRLKTLLYLNRKQLMLYCPRFVRLAKLMIKARGLKSNTKNYERIGHFFGQRSYRIVKMREAWILTDPQRMTPSIKKYVDDTEVADLPCTDARKLNLKP